MVGFASITIDIEVRDNLECETDEQIHKYCDILMDSEFMNKIEEAIQQYLPSEFKAEIKY